MSLIFIPGPRLADNFTIIDNRLLADTRISVLAKHIVIYFQWKPPGWQTDSTRLARELGVSREQLRRALRELDAAGYRESTRAQVPDPKRPGQKVWATQVTVRAVPEGGFPDTVGKRADTFTGDRQGVPCDSQGTDTPSPVPPAETPDGDGPCEFTGDRDTGRLCPDPLRPGPSKQGPTERTEIKKAAASGDHYQSTGGGKVTEPDPEPSPDVLKILSGCGVDPHAKAWARAAEEALARGGIPLDIIDHVVAPVTGEPRSVEAIRLTRLRTWPGSPSPRSSDELYAELRTEYPAVPPVALLRPSLPPWCGRCGIDTGNDPEFVRKNPRFRYLAGRRCPACHPDLIGTP